MPTSSCSSNYQPGRIFAALFCLLLLLLPKISFAEQLSIAVHASSQLLANAPCRLAVADAISLLEQAFPQATVALNGRAAQVSIYLPTLDIISPAPSAKLTNRPATGSDSFQWQSRRMGATTTTLYLSARSPQGVTNGIYALLQEKLGIRFVHPRQTIMPHHRSWPLPAAFTFAGQPVFANRGFHLHTLHPIELTEQLHNPQHPGALTDVQRYLDWLARNGQNTFQFFLLRGIDRHNWIPHARQIVDYAHSRGIDCGVELSLAMLQQQAFQAITLLRPFPSYRRQVDATLAWLFQAPWDFITLEATMGEHLPFLGRFLPNVQSHFEQQVVERYRARLLYATHVICPTEGEKVRRPNVSTSGILIHTVMCYSATEAKAPVYGNLNQRFMLEAAQTEAKKRETWYWPESSYWVAFDSSVPLLLLPYLTARWDDIQATGKLHLPGHLTFTSGWEWGYWLVDWSIARWAWQYTDNRATLPTSPVSRLNDLFPDKEQQRLFQAALDLQQSYLKDKELLRFMSALTPFSELPHPFDQPFQPDPEFSYHWLLDRATATQATAAVAKPLADLDAYDDKMQRIASALATRNQIIANRRPSLAATLPLVEELTTGLQVSALRARHRAVTIRALLAKKQELSQSIARPDSTELLLQAQGIRTEALQHVRQQEMRYRYPTGLLAQQRPSLTAYPFGYLYPVTNLFFWEREEEQVRQERFDAMFINLWDMRRTLGLESLLFR